MMLETGRLIMREFEADDWSAVYELESDPEVRRYQRADPMSEEQSKEYVARAITRWSEQPRRDYCLAIVLKTWDQFIGVCRVRISDFESRQGLIGYDVHRGYWNRGYATEAARRVIAFGFSELSLHRISAQCNAENRASARVLEKCWMRLEAHFREHLFVKGEWRDDLQYAILEEEWRNGMVVSG